MSTAIPQLHASGDYAVSKYIETGGQVVIGQPREYIIASRNGGSANLQWNSRPQYYFNKLEDAISTNTEMKIQLAVPTVTGGVPSAISYVNQVAIFMFSKIRFLCNQRNICEEVDPQLFANWLRLNVPIDEWPIVAAQIGCYDNAAARQALVTAGVIPVYYFPVHWLFRYLQQFPLDLIANDMICLEFWLQPSASYVVQYTGGTAPVAAATVTLLEMRLATKTTKVSNYLKAKSYSGDSVRPYGLSSGLLFEGNDFLTKSFPIAASATSAQLAMPELSDKLVKAIILTTQATADLSPAGTVAYDAYTNVITSFNIVTGSKYVDGTDSFPITPDMLQRDLARNHIPGVYQLKNGGNTTALTNAQYRIFCDNLDQDSLDEGMPGFDGAYDYFGVTNQQINVTFSAGIAATTLYVHVIYARRDVLGFKSGRFDELQSLIRKPSNV